VFCEFSGGGSGWLVISSGNGGGVVTRGDSGGNGVWCLVKVTQVVKKWWCLFSFSFFFSGRFDFQKAHTNRHNPLEKTKLPKLLLDKNNVALSF
jgi:hypothetical protein